MFSISTILVALAGYFALFFGIGWFLRNWGTTKQKYLLADRRAGLVECTLLVAGCWTAGLTMIVPPQQAYLNGWVSWTWFTYPQLLGMLIFSWFSTVIYQKIRSGYTISSYINERYGNQVSILYQLVFCFSGLGLILTTFTAVLKFLAFIHADRPALITAIIVVCTVVYSWKGGHAENVGYGAPLDTTVAWTLSRTANGTRLRLVHAGFVVPRNNSALDTIGSGWKKVVPTLGAIAGEQD